MMVVVLVDRISLAVFPAITDNCVRIDPRNGVQEAFPRAGRSVPRPFQARPARARTSADERVEPGQDLAVLAPCSAVRTAAESRRGPRPRRGRIWRLCGCRYEARLNSFRLALGASSSTHPSYRGCLPALWPGRVEREGGTISSRPSKKELQCRLDSRSA